jgi:hypothetical protein
MKLERGKVDLGSVMIKRQLYIDTRSSFLPLAMFTKDLFARDFMIVQRMITYLKLRSKSQKIGSMIAFNNNKPIKTKNRIKTTYPKKYFYRASDEKRPFLQGPAKTTVDDAYEWSNVVFIIPKILMFHQ